jgi:hypothetical protein
VLPRRRPKGWEVGGAVGGGYPSAGGGGRGGGLRVRVSEFGFGPSMAGRPRRREVWGVGGPAATARPMAEARRRGSAAGRAGTGGGPVTGGEAHRVRKGGLEGGGGW